MGSGSKRKVKRLVMSIYCDDCKIECITTETGILCPSCGAFITDEQMDMDP